MDSSTDRRYTFRPTRELPDILLDQELYAQIRNIIVTLDRHFLILQPENMCYELLRLLTFILYFPRNIGIHVIRAYAIAGFYCTRERDFVVCYRCGFSFGNLEPGPDDPYEVHRRNAQHCDFFRNRMINIPFFLVTEGGLRRSNERTAIRHRVSAGPTPVMPADEVQRNILSVLERRHREINGEHFVIDINNGNDLPAPDLHQGRTHFVNTLTAINLEEILNIMVNEIPLSVNDLGIDIRPDFSHSLEWSESERVLADPSNRQTNSYQSHISSIRALTGVTQEEAENSMSDRLEEPEIAIATNESISFLQQENSTDTHCSERLSDDESELVNCNSNEISIRIRGIMTADLPPHQHISYDSTERGENENTSATHHLEETQLKIVCETDMKGNCPNPEHSDISVCKTNNKGEEGVNANSAKTCRKTLHSSGFSARMNANIPNVTDIRNKTQVTKCKQILYSNLSDQTAQVINVPDSTRIAETEPTENGISTPKTVDSNGKDSDNSHFKLLPRHNNEPVSANISGVVNELIYEGTDDNIPSNESQHKGDEKHAKSSLDGRNIPVQGLSGIHSVKDNTITADAESIQTKTNGNAVRASSTETQTGEEDNCDVVEQKHCIPNEDKNSVKTNLTAKNANYETEQNVLKDVNHESTWRREMKPCKSENGMTSNTEVVKKPGNNNCFSEDRMENHVKHLNCKEKSALDVALNDCIKCDDAKQNNEHSCEYVEAILSPHDENGQLGAHSFSNQSIPDNDSRTQNVIITNLHSSQPLSDISANFSVNATAAASADTNTLQETGIREMLCFGADNSAKEQILQLSTVSCEKVQDIPGLSRKGENYSGIDLLEKNTKKNLPSNGYLCKWREKESPSIEMKEKMGPNEQNGLVEKSGSQNTVITEENSKIVVLNAPESDKPETGISQPEDAESQEENIAAPHRHIVEYQRLYRPHSNPLLPTSSRMISHDISLDKRRNSWTTSAAVGCAVSKHTSSTQYCGIRNLDQGGDLKVCLKQTSDISDDRLVTQTCQENAQCDTSALINAQKFHKISAKIEESNKSNATDVDDLVKSALDDLHKIKDHNRKKNVVLNFHKEIIDIQSEEISDSDKSLKCVDSCKRYFGLFVRCMSYMNDCCNQGI